MPSIVAGFVRLTREERGVLLRALFTLATARVAIWTLPFARVRRLLTPRPGGRVDPRMTPGRVSWAISRAQRVIPDATCLPQAVTAEAMLARGGRPSLLRIGVTKKADGSLLAHAWVESERRVIVGDLPGGLGELSHLPPLPQPWDGAR
jgi:hypothetical protein